MNTAKIDYLQNQREKEYAEYCFDENWTASWDADGQSHVVTYILNRFGSAVDTVYVYDDGSVATHSGKPLSHYDLSI